MSLQNLLKIGQLAEHDTDARQVARLLVAAKRGIADAHQKSVSLETRLDAAYRAIMQLSMLALWANGYRPSRKALGHHHTMIHSLIHTIDLDRDQVLLLDTFRVKRNAMDYTGDDADAGSVEACIKAADNLHECLSNWLAENRPDLAN